MEIPRYRRAILFLLLMIIHGAMNTASNGTVYAQITIKQGTVTAKGGLALREQPGKDAKRLTIIPYNAKVSILDDQGPAETIGNIPGSWYKVQYDNQTGWAFGGYIAADNGQAMNKGKKITQEYGGFTLTVQRPCDDYSRYDKCFPSALPGTVLDKNGSVMAEIDAVDYNHYHCFEVRGHEIFWISWVGNPAKKGDLLYHRLWVMDAQTKSKTKLLEYQGIDFRASPDGGTVAFTKGCDLGLLKRKSGVTTFLAKNGGEGGYDDGFTLLDWSRKGDKFWFGSGVVGGWSKLGLYRNGKITWFPYGRNGIDDAALEPDLGWLALSDAPMFFEADSANEFVKSGKTTELIVIEVLTGKKASIARVKGSAFSPSWDEKGSLDYKVSGKKEILVKEKIESIMK